MVGAYIAENQNCCQADKRLQDFVLYSRCAGEDFCDAPPPPSRGVQYQGNDYRLVTAATNLRLSQHSLLHAEEPPQAASRSMAA
jgi:hypothetical protein